MAQKPFTRGACSMLPRFRIYSGKANAFDPEMAGLLEALQKTGSIKDARQLSNTSYMYAWKLAQAMNRHFREPLLITKRGGKVGGGGTTLTGTGREVLAIYRRMERKSININRSDWKKFQQLLKREMAKGE